MKVHGSIVGQRLERTLHNNSNSIQLAWVGVDIGYEMVWVRVGSRYELAWVRVGKVRLG